MDRNSRSTARDELLDADSPDTVRMTVKDAFMLGKRSLCRIGYSDEEAEIIVDQLIDDTLCGYGWAGLSRILVLAKEDRPRSTRYPVKIVHETPVSASVDGGNNVGYLAVHRGTEIAIEKAKNSGISVVGIYNSYYSGRNAYYVERIVRAGFATIHTATAIPRVVPMGGARPALGPNPISIGFPSAKGPVIFDTATAAVSWGEVIHFAHIGKDLPAGVGFDADGHSSRDARKVLLGGVAPFGGHRGYGLSFAIQALGLLAGSALARGRVQDFGFFFVVIDPNLLHPNDKFPEQMTELVTQIKATPRQPGVDEIRIPSERAFRERERRRKEGIVLYRDVIDALESL